MILIQYDTYYDLSFEHKSKAFALNILPYSMKILSEVDISNDESNTEWQFALGSWLWIAEHSPRESFINNLTKIILPSVGALYLDSNSSSLQGFYQMKQIIDNTLVNFNRFNSLGTSFSNLEIILKTSPKYAEAIDQMKNTLNQIIKTNENKDKVLATIKSVLTNIQTKKSITNSDAEVTVENIFGKKSYLDDKEKNDFKDQLSELIKADPEVADLEGFEIMADKSEFKNFDQYLDELLK